MIKTIYICWLQGFNKAPNVVKRCVQSWKYYNPDWNIILIDYTNLKDYIDIEKYIPDIFLKSIEKPHFSDIVRCILLKNYGGLWADATTFCNKPLNSWLPEYIKEGFFAFNKPYPNIILSNWFLYSEKNGYIIQKWCEATINYYTTHDKAETYLIHHYLFKDLYNSDIHFKDIWDKVPVILALSKNESSPHYFLVLGYFESMTIQNKLDIDSKVTPLYKLTYKTKFSKYNEKLLIYYLYSTIKKSKKNV